MQCTASTYKALTPPPGEVVEDAMADLGLSESESAVYLALMKYGPKPAAAVARFASVSRPHTYQILERLNRRGLVSSHSRNNVQQFKAVPLQELIFALERKEAELARRRNQLQDLQSTLVPHGAELWLDPVTNSYRGPEVRARIFQELMHQELSQRVIVFCSAQSSVFFDDLPPTPAALLELSQMIPCRNEILLFGGDESTALLVSQSASENIKELEVNFPVEMVVTAGKITLISRRGTVPYSISIEQFALAAGFRALIASQLETINSVKGGRPA